MKTTRILLASSFLLLASSFQSCASIHSSGSQPGRAPTAMEQVMVWNANLADANLAIAKGVIGASEANEITVLTANAILTEQSRIADADRQLTPVLAKACSVVPPSTTASTLTGQVQPGSCNPAMLSGDSATIQGFLNQIAASGKNLVATGTAGIKNKQRAKTVGDAITAIATLSGEMTSSLKSLGVLQ
jgi:hypothetical protein